MTLEVGNLLIDGSNPPFLLQFVSASQDWRPEGYERAVRAQLSRIRQQPAGRLLLQYIRMRTIIVPSNELQPNASAEADPNSSVSPDRGFRQGLPIRHPSTGRPIPERGNGLGGGTEARVEYTPADWIPGSRLYNQSRPPIGRADEHLFHELFHAMRYTWGLVDRRPLRGEMAGYENHAEFFAIAVTNVYLAQAGVTNLRSTHRVVGDQNAYQLNEATFMQDPENARLIRILCQDQREFTRAIALQEGRFNPFRIHYLSTGEIRPSQLRTRQTTHGR